MLKQDFLVELGTEELPPKALPKLAKAFANGLSEELAQAGIKYEELKPYATPRRLAVLVEGINDHQADQQIERRGPSAKAPEKAVQGFAASCGVSIEQLEIIPSEKGEYYYFKAIEKGQPTPKLLPQLVETALTGLPIPKYMRWGSSRIEFTRPVHWLVMLWGEQVIECEILGLKAGRETRGHRIHHNQAIEIKSPPWYVDNLQDTGKVIADFDTRRQIIQEQLLAEGKKLNAVVQIDEDLLNEVTALTEWPVALTGTFDKRFLEVPAEALISSMKEHQKYFHHFNQQGQLLPNFTTISNLDSKDPTQVIAGNEKVIRPRLADAAFFFETDKKQTLASRVDKLKQILFQKELGTLHDKAQRISKLAGKIATHLGEEPSKAERAGLLAKTDLTTEMVFEFTDLQGLMGYYYALNDGEDHSVATAQKEQYLPRFSGDYLPVTTSGIAVAIADRLDTLVGLFSINQPPTGSKDPFALRRAALGILRIIVERELELDLRSILIEASKGYSSLPHQEGATERVFEFMLGRFRAWYEDEGIHADSVLAVLAVTPSRPLDFDRRVRAVNYFRKLTEAKALAAANKRISNILSQQQAGELLHINDSLLSEASEIALSQKLLEQEKALTPLFEAGNYQEAMTSLASLQPDIDRFFEEVLVVDQNEQVKNNRLALLNRLRTLFLKAADISILS